MNNIAWWIPVIALAVIGISFLFLLNTTGKMRYLAIGAAAMATLVMLVVLVAWPIEEELLCRSVYETEEVIIQVCRK